MDRLTREMILLYIENAKSRIRFNAGEDVESVESRNAAIYDLRVHELALQSLSQEAVREAVRDEALDEAANELERAFAEVDTLNLLHGAARVRALKREPNAAGEEAGKEPGRASGDMPAPAAPDVANEATPTAEWLEAFAEGLIHPESPFTQREIAQLRKAAALLARLGLGLVPVREDLRTIDKELDHGIDD